jgi:hypothetical protein
MRRRFTVTANHADRAMHILPLTIGSVLTRQMFEDMQAVTFYARSATSSTPTLTLSGRPSCGRAISVSHGSGSASYERAAADRCWRKHARRTGPCLCPERQGRRVRGS